MSSTQQTFKILGLLLTYPEGTIYNASEELLEILRTEDVLPKKHIQRIEHFLHTQRYMDLLKAQEDYVATFDRGRAYCLHLFEHIHGESRDRGQAMVALIETYATKGLFINNNELPDYLPLFLEYLSRCPFNEASELLGETIAVIAMIEIKLKKHKSPYADIFAAIQALSAVKPDKAGIADTLEKSSKDPQTLEELDEQWKEAEAFGGKPPDEGWLDCNTHKTFPSVLETSKGDKQ